MLAEYLHTFINTFRQQEVLTVILNVPDQTPPLVLSNLDLFSLFSATHNEESIYNIIEIMNSKGINKDDSNIWFGQLYGMSDNITFNLASKGFNVIKYLPYGPIKEVIPYLIRRAEENTSVKGQTSRELELIKKELKRRKSI